jgi:hypothetical protein
VHVLVTIVVIALSSLVSYRISAALAKFEPLQRLLARLDPPETDEEWWDRHT